MHLTQVCHRLMLVCKDFATDPAGVCAACCLLLLLLVVMMMMIVETRCLWILRDPW